jgi:hypothetical protein
VQAAYFGRFGNVTAAGNIILGDFLYGYKEFTINLHNM